MIRLPHLLLALWALLIPALAAAAEPVGHYRLDARFDAAAGRVKAKVEVTLPPDAVPADFAFILGRRFTLSPVEVPGAKVTVEQADAPLPELQKVVIAYDTPPTKPITVRFAYEGPLEGPSGAGAFSAERVELNLEDAWLPVRADLNLYFTLDAEIAGLPPGVVAVTQGTLKQRAGRLSVRRTTLDNDFTLTGAPGLTARTAPDLDFRAVQQDDALVATLREHATGSAAFYRGLYGDPIAGDVRMVILPRASSGGYARRGFVVMPDFRKPGDPTPKFDSISLGRFVAHEFSHAWLPAVAPGGENFWVSESVAEYLSMRYLEGRFGLEARKAMLERKRAAAAKAGPMIGDRRPSGVALYQKGPVLLFDLEARIGRPALDRILIRRDRPLTNADFLKALAAEAGDATATAFAEDLKREGLRP